MQKDGDKEDQSSKIDEETGLKISELSPETIERKLRKHYYKNKELVKPKKTFDA